MAKGREVIKGGKGVSFVVEVGILRYRSNIDPSNSGAKLIANERMVTKAIARKRPKLGLGAIQIPMRYAKIAGA